MTRTISTTLLLPTLIFLMLGTLACGDAEDGYDREGVFEEGYSSSLGPERSAVEEQLAEELAALLPGMWAWDEASSVRRADLAVTFLGQDALRGDLALLVESIDDDLQPARVVLSDDQAVIELPDIQTRYTVDAIEDDRLVMVDMETGDKHVYRRVR